MNVGYSPQTRADSTAIAKSFAWQARVEFPEITPCLHRRRVVEIQESGGIALAFDLEDSNPLEGDLANVSYFYDLGVRSMLPTYNYMNAAGCGCLDLADTGLSGYGRDLVAEMNRVGMTVDGSHCSVQTGLDISAITQRAMIYSHSNLRRLWEHPRNITDDQPERVRRPAASSGSTAWAYSSASTDRMTTRLGCPRWPTTSKRLWDSSASIMSGSAPTSHSTPTTSAKRSSRTRRRSPRRTPRGGATAVDSSGGGADT